ncbi:hypothetical protein Kpho01_43120 [Kitasatospora phosalacinea]|uniref:Uncharacterized protein n=1 Tax=Kitasatospora phosalacinea TaxID=2065 RepID=A0A9W6PJP0_9ACTN|nr:hypothetical protein Kpho01_43120 [Kitasatospora phosalacinea]
MPSPNWSVRLVSTVIEPETFVGSEFTDGAADVPPPPLLLQAVSTTMEAAPTASHPLRISLILHAVPHRLRIGPGPLDA